KVGALELDCLLGLAIHPNWTFVRSEVGADGGAVRLHRHAIQVDVGTVHQLQAGTVFTGGGNGAALHRDGAVAVPGDIARGTLARNLDVDVVEFDAGGRADWSHSKRHDFWRYYSRPHTVCSVTGSRDGGISKLDQSTIDRQGAPGVFTAGRNGAAGEADRAAALPLVCVI